MGMIFNKNQVLLNTGSILGPFISGVIYSIFGSRAAFFTIQIFIILAMIDFCIFYIQENVNIKINKSKLLKISLIQLLILGMVFFFSMMYFLSVPFKLIELFIWIIISGIVVYQFKNIQIHILSINLICILFFTVYSQINGSLILFVNNYIFLNRIHNFLLPPQWFFSLEPAFIIFFALVIKIFPGIVAFFENISIIRKLAFAMLLLAISFSFLAIISHFYLNVEMKISAFWLVPFYFFISLSEFVFIPVIFSYLSKAAPSRLSGLVFGYYFISKGIGVYISLNISKAIFSASLSPIRGLYQYIDMFGLLAILAALSAIIIFFAKFIVNFLSKIDATFKTKISRNEFPIP